MYSFHLLKLFKIFELLFESNPLKLFKSSNVMFSVFFISKIDE